MQKDHEGMSKMIKFGIPAVIVGGSFYVLYKCFNYKNKKQKTTSIKTEVAGITKYDQCVMSFKVPEYFIIDREELNSSVYELLIAPAPKINNSDTNFLITIKDSIYYDTIDQEQIDLIRQDPNYHSDEQHLVNGVAIHKFSLVDKWIILACVAKKDIRITIISDLSKCEEPDFDVIRSFVEDLRFDVNDKGVARALSHKGIALNLPNVGYHLVPSSDSLISLQSKSHNVNINVKKVTAVPSTSGFDKRNDIKVLNTSAQVFENISILSNHVVVLFHHHSDSYVLEARAEKTLDKQDFFMQVVGSAASLSFENQSTSDLVEYTNFEHRFMIKVPSTFELMEKWISYKNNPVQMHCRDDYDELEMLVDIKCEEAVARNVSELEGVTKTYFAANDDLHDEDQKSRTVVRVGAAGALHYVFCKNDLVSDVLCVPQKNKVWYVGATVPSWRYDKFKSDIDGILGSFLLM